MQLYKSVLLFVIVYAIAFAIQAQQKQWVYRFYNTAHGLPSSEILTVAKDKQGFLWIGTTAGLSKYDGYRFHNYAYTSKNQPLGSVNKLTTDSSGRLWIATSTGLFCFINNQLTQLNNSTALPQGVNDIVVNEKNMFWLATENGPALLTMSELDLTGEKKINLQQYVIKQWNSKEPDGYKRRVTLVSEAVDGTVYFAQPGKVYRFAKNEMSLFHSHADVYDIIQNLFAVNYSTLYFDCSSTEMNKVEKGVHSYSSSSQFYRPGETNNTKGVWYAGTSGVFYFHPQTGTASVFINLLKDDVIWPSAAVKDENCIWAATHDGLIRIKPSLFTVYDWRKLSVHNDFYSAVQLNSGSILLGSNRGKIFSETKDGFVYYKDGVVPKAEVKAMYEDERGWLWAGSGYQGLSVVRNGTVTQYTMKEGIHSLTLLHILKTSKGKLYATGSEGTTEIIVAAGQQVSFKKHAYKPRLSQKAYFYSAIEGPDGRLWLAGEEGIVYLENDSLHSFSFKNTPLSINSMVKDKNGMLWLAANGKGIFQCKFNAAHQPEIIKQLTLNDGLHTLSYLHLLADNNKHIWAASSAGISCVIPGQNQYRVLNFDESDGFLKPGYSYIRLFEGSDERIWTVTTTGFSSFNTGIASARYTTPVVYVTDVISKKQNAAVWQNKFNYNDNALTFHFTALDYSAQEGIVFYYRMNGLDTGFTNNGRQSISYENLAPGKYTFRVKALSTKSVWSKEEAVYSFIIEPPFWKQWWFKLFFILFFAAAAYLFIKLRERKIREKEAQKTALEKLNKDLANWQLAALKAQMNPHFIFNAMNSIQQFTLKNDIDNANLYISKFSTLLRKVLHASQLDYISLEEEAEQLKLYIEIEKLRLGDQFSFTIEIADEIEADAVKIPGMLVQPFVENALKHGLSLKEGYRKLEVCFSLSGEKKLQATITDNGIGRQKALELKKQNEKLLPHNSKGILLVQERLALLNPTGAGTHNIRITDLYDDTGKASGTQVMIHFP
jgi:ligand-binding sensor domain-containing protein